MKHSENECRQEWLNSYDDEKRENVRICALYYAQSGVMEPSLELVSLAFRSLRISSFIPTEKEYKKLCENKYAKKILNISRSKHKFKPAQIVELRKILHSSVRNGLCNGEKALVIENNYDVTSIKKGRRQYKILPFGTAVTYYVQEKELKAHKK